MQKPNLNIVTVSSIMSVLFFINCGKSESTAEVNDFVYVLQNIDLDALGETAFDLATIDYSQDGSDDTRFTAQEINDLKNSPGGDKIALAYVSIGEAENYRWYWQDEWDSNNDG